MKSINAYIEYLKAGQNLSAGQMRSIMQACMQAELSDDQIVSFLRLMRAKGETAEELSAAAQVMMDLTHPIDLGDNLIDIVGTGGDGKNSFNISTISSIVASAAGVRVAKHGNLSVSSSSGSANLLQEAGIAVDLNDEQLKTCMQENQFCFLFAPRFHPAMQAVRSARQKLGTRSFFNLLGPVLNPAKVKRQVIGVFNQQFQEPLAKVLSELGSERALIVSSEDGLDEISMAAKTQVLEYYQGSLKTWTIDPTTYGINYRSLEAIMVHSPRESLDLIQQVLQGAQGAARDIVLLNTAAALYCADIATDFPTALAKAAQTLDQGAAFKRFKQLQTFSSKMKS